MKDRSLIWIATITAGAGFLGAIVGGGVTYLTNKQNIESASGETIRAERTEAYHAFLTAAQDVAAFIEPLPGAPTEEQERQIGELSSRFNNQFALVLVVAPDDTKEAAIEVVSLVGRTIETGFPPENFREALVRFAQAADDDLGRG
jgi:hypothetical protein